MTPLPTLYGLPWATLVAPHSGLIVIMHTLGCHHFGTCLFSHMHTSSCLLEYLHVPHSVTDRCRFVTNWCCMLVFVNINVSSPVLLLTANQDHALHTLQHSEWDS